MGLEQTACGAISERTLFRRRSWCGLSLCSKLYAGVEIHTRWEYPLFDLDNFEHRAFFAGPSIHYSQERWWATLTWNYQVYGKGVDEPADGQTFAEETRQLFRLKVGFNF